MPEEKGDKSFDYRLLEPRYDFRRTVPKDVDDRLISLLRKRPKGRGQTEGTLIEDKLEPTDQENLYQTERELAKIILREFMRPAVKIVGDQNFSIVPYETRSTVDPAIYEAKEVSRVIENLTKGKSTERSRLITGELDHLTKWLEGNAAILKGAGPMLQMFYDGWGAMLAAVRMVPRYDVTAEDLYKLFSSPAELPEWRLGQEILKKQDKCFKLMRGIAAGGGSRSRIFGQAVVDDYPINHSQIEFAEMVFGRNAKDEKGQATGPVRTIDTVTNKQGLAAMLEESVREDQDEWIEPIIVGKRFVLTSDLLKRWQSNLDLRGKTLWVNGARWDITPETLKELEWKADCQDIVFLGEQMLTLKPSQAKDALSQLRDKDEIATTRLIPREIDSLFVMAQDPSRTTEVKRKLAVLMGTDVWGKMERGEITTNQAFQEYGVALEAYNKSGEHSLDIIDEHILETSRIGLLYACEGARLGWSFDYKEDTVGKKGAKVARRVVSYGGTKAATDISTPFFWLMTEGANLFKGWTKGALPMDEKTARQLLDHEPGWAPWVGEPGGAWKVTYKGVPMVIDAPTNFRMSLFESAKFVEGPPELKKQVFDRGKNKLVDKSKNIMDLIKEGTEMSQIPWANIVQEAPYRWFITLSQIGLAKDLVSILPGKEAAARFVAVDAADLTERTLAQARELMKRTDLSFRDMEAAEDAKRFIPLETALFTAYALNLLPESPFPGRFRLARVKEKSEIMAFTLSDIKSRGDAEFGNFMAARLRNYMDALLKMGLKVSMEEGARKLKARGGGFF